MGESEFLESMDGFGNSHLHVCAADCVCHETKLVDVVCFPASQTPASRMVSTNVCTEMTEAATACPHGSSNCNVSASCSTCVAYANLITDMDRHVSRIYDNNKMTVQRKLEKMYEKYKGTKHKQSWLSVKNQIDFQNSLDNFCAHIAKLDLIGGYDDMKEIACIYICHKLCLLHPHHLVVFDFWKHTLVRLLDLHQDHLLKVCMEYWRTQWEQVTTTIPRQAILKGVRMLIKQFPSQMHTRFLEVNIYVYALSSILHTLQQDVKLQS